MTEPILVHRTGLVHLRFLHAFYVVSGMAGVALLVFTPLRWWTVLISGVCVFTTLKQAPGMASAVDRVELDGRTLRWRRLWSRRTREASLDDVRQVRTTLCLDDAGRVAAYGHELGFGDGELLALMPSCMPGVEGVMAEARSFPFELGGLYLTQWIHAEPGPVRMFNYVRPGVRVSLGIHVIGPIPDHFSDVVEMKVEGTRLEYEGQVEEVETVTLGEPPHATDARCIRLGHPDALVRRLYFATVGSELLELDCVAGETDVLDEALATFLPALARHVLA